MKKRHTRSLSSCKLLNQLKQDNRLLVCEVCRETNLNLLEVHHVMPVAISDNNLSHNLAILCRNHHSLVERYYWWERCKLNPSETKELKQIAILFSKRKVEPNQLNDLQEKTKLLWKKLNSHVKVQNFFWWHSCYEAAKGWASTQLVIRSVSAKDAIVEEPWFRLKDL